MNGELRLGVILGMNTMSTEATGPHAPAPRPDGEAEAPGRDAGSALVEFTAVIGLLLFLVLGTVSFGVLLATTHQLNEAAGESARTAALAWDDPGTGTDERIDTAMASLESSGVDCGPPGAVTCSVTVAACDGEPSASCATVSLTHDRAIDPLVGRIPLLEGVLPDELHAEATVMVTP
jgi:hypothetical protein